MKKFIPLMCALPLAISTAFAGDFNNDSSVTAYWQIPLSVSKTGKEHQAFGFRMDQIVRDNAGNLVSSFSAPQRPAVLDFRFSDKGVEGLFLRGVNMTSPLVMNAAANGKEDDSAVWWILGGAALGAAILINEGDDHGGASTGGEGPCCG